MQLILVRHAQPERLLESSGPADPDLTAVGVEQAGRVPAALAPHRIARVVSSPQLRARETARPTAEKLGLDIEILDGLAEYDRDLPMYIPIEDAQQEFRETYERIKAGYLPEQIDGDAFVRRVLAAVDGIVAAAEHTDTVVVFAHGGVINVLLQQVLGLARPLTFPIDYCSITRILYSRTGGRTVATVNENGHVWDLLPRTRPRP
ncbi:histidine phosphatase family protein [Nocardia seriolae]|uniref:Phosphoglycerate mutase (2,3-diphosphoglycerate-independent) n=1 Tax=Nocardia seriolae TaxID=37332 RepID=A0A0B8MZN3_9NOCA|nr:histidine phosphatase family protein [Nocardia seriolae]APA94758.1 Phosphoglycerate mutase (2,3-diphosphoglycerate-independent) [Nocardia seriolae]MTJ60053.1 histidine phosphatase family protein [Nocardia seriolae]MTJ70123.1 histidine phosphatase family protein [Nocardia seriolae]MTJ85055.1 histidine phosphatase family protein [Nocardia seriolae]MTK29050.1 histidine phosphatase family protein [Nocardia seriolae]